MKYIDLVGNEYRVLVAFEDEAAARRLLRALPSAAEQGAPVVDWLARGDIEVLKLLLPGCTAIKVNRFHRNLPVSDDDEIDGVLRTEALEIAQGIVEHASDFRDGLMADIRAIVRRFS